MRSPERIVILCPFGVYPPRSGGHSAVLEPARAMARAGASVHLFGMGIRRFEAMRRFRSFEREIEPRLVEERSVGLWNYLDFLRRGRSGLPPKGASEHLARCASRRLRERCAAADVLEYESPWLFPALRGNTPAVLVAHNAETRLAAALPDLDSKRVRDLAGKEREAWEGADAVICFTVEDRDSLAADYGEREHVHMIPIGVDVEANRPAKPEERERARRMLGLEDQFVVLFTGAWHVPNRKAKEQVAAWAEDAPPGWTFVVAGSVSSRRARRGSLLSTGLVPDLGPWFAAADVAVNPVTEGGGANVKMLEYLARGLPVLSTPFGARGLSVRDGRHLLLRETGEFPDALGALREDPALRRRLGEAGRSLVLQERSWDAVTRRRLEVLASVAGGRSGAGGCAG